MDREQAIEQLYEFKTRTGVSRDKAIEIYQQFMANSCVAEIGIVIKGEIVKFQREEFWSYINTTDIREVYSSNITKISKNEEFETEMTKLRQEKLRQSDKLRYERNAFNKNLRNLNALEELNKELIEGLKKLKPVNVYKNIFVPSEESNDVLLVQLSDLHINELTNEFRNTNYDINTANARLWAYAESIKYEITTRGIKKVVIGMTGDICNSDSILSKQQNNATDKATSILIATKLLQHFILDIYSVCQNISICGVSGNEGRLHNMSDFFTDENLVTNSPDFIILNFLEMLLGELNGIKFIKGRNAELIVNINGNNILFTHGVSLSKGDLGKSVQQTIARYSDKGIHIRYVVLGHLHATKISNYFMRSSSLVGNNSYATTTLNLNSRASQNIAFISDNGDITPMAIDLENIDGINGYDVKEDFKNFNIKTATKRLNDDIIEFV